MLYYGMYLSINIILEFVLANEKEKIVVSDEIMMTVVFIKCFVYVKLHKILELRKEQGHF